MRTIVNFSNLPWVPGRLKRNQALFQHLLASDDHLSAGVFVNPPAIAGRYRKYLPHASIQLAGSLTTAGKPVSIVQPLYSLPDWHLPPLTARWAGLVAEQLMTWVSDAPFWLWMNSAGKLQHALLMHLIDSADMRIFDSSDDFTAWERPDYSVRLHELVARSDKLLCVNDHVAAQFDHADKCVFHNCTDFHAFQQRNPSFRLEPWFPKPAGSVYVGFTGGLNSTRADQALLESLFHRFPKWTFVFVGYTDNPRFVDRLLTFPNVAFVRERPYGELPDIIRAFNVAIVPHLDNPTTRGNDLLKVLDYLACGVPVVSTLCSGVQRYGDVIHIARSADEFADALETLVVSGSHDPQRGIQVAACNDWKRRVPMLQPWLTSQPVST